MLTDQKVKALKPKEKQYKVSDEKGLYLLIKPNAGKYWHLKYRFAGKEKNLAIGVYPTVSLKQTRLARDDAKRLIQSGLDPVQVKQEQKLKRLELSNNSYEVVAREWIEKKRTQWSNHNRTTVHGFRATASTILNEMGYNHDAIERQLAHAESNKVRAAYNRAEYLPERTIIMQDWSNLIESMATDNTTYIVI